MADKTHSVKYSVLLLMAVLLSMVQACAQRPLDTSAAPMPPVSAERETAVDTFPFYGIAEYFLNAYLAKPNDVDVMDWIDDSPYLTEEFKQAHRKLLTDAYAKYPNYGLGFDPIIDGQDSPEVYRILAVDSTLHVVTLKGEPWEEFRARAHVINIDGRSFVNGCGVINMPEVAED